MCPGGRQNSNPDDTQRGNFGTRLAEPFIVQVLDRSNGLRRDGNPVSGQEVMFTITTPTSGANLVADPDFPPALYDDFPNIVKTDEKGMANVFLELQSIGANPTEQVIEKAAGHTVTASFGPASVANITFGATGRRATAAASVNIDDGDGQSAALDQSLTKALTVIVRDLGGGIVQNIPVTFTTDSGALSPPSRKDPGMHDSSESFVNSDRSIVIRTDGNGKASVRYNVGDIPGAKNVYATITAYDGQTRRKTFNINGRGGPSEPSNAITITLSSTTGEPGDEIDVTVTSDPSGVLVNINSGELTDADFSRLSGGTTFTSTLILPDEEGEYTFSATRSDFTSDSASVTVEAELGTLSITAIGTPDAGSQTFSISAVDADGDRAIGAFTARLSGTGFTSRNVEISGGRGNARVTLPTAARLYTLTVSADGYIDGSTPVRITADGQVDDTDDDTDDDTADDTTAAEPDSIEITGPSTRSGTVDEELDTPLLVRVLDDDGDGLEGARVFYRVISGRGRLSARGNGRAIGVVTDEDGYARAVFTPTDGGTITVRANTDDLSATVTFTITTGSASSASGARDSGTGGTPGMISPGCACRCGESSADVMGRRWCNLRTCGRESPKIRSEC